MAAVILLSMLITMVRRKADSDIHGGIILLSYTQLC